MGIKVTVNELGEKSADIGYVCKVCRKNVKSRAAVSEKWFYTISGKSTATSKGLLHARLMRNDRS